MSTKSNAKQWSSSRLYSATQGMTVVELLVVIAISAVLAAIAIPSIANFISENRLRMTSLDIVSDLNYARSEAIKRNARVLVCAKASGSNTCANTTNWANGWLVCYDADSDNTCDAGSAADPNPLRIVGVLNASLTLTSTNNLVRFNPVGSANAANVFSLTGNWTSASSRTASVAATGVITSTKN